MGLMDFYLANLTIESPTIIPRRRSATGYVGVRETIPGSTLGGAILSSLRRHNRITAQEAEEFAKDHALISSPAFPREKNLLYPAHPFIWRCKEPGCGRYVTKLDEVLKVLEEGCELGPTAIALTCQEGHRALEKMHPRPLPAATLSQGCKSPGEKKEGLESVKVVSVPVSRHRASSIVGALYSYETLPTGLEYWAILTVRQGILDERVDVLRLGRGISKGFGKVKLSLKKLDVNKLQKALPAKAGHTVLYSLSPVVLRGVEHTIDLGAYTGLSGGVRVKAVYGSSTTIGGWDIRRNIEWRVVNAASPGSLVLAEVEGDGTSVAHGLILLGLMGEKIDFGGFTLVGLNMMMPIDIILGDVLAS